MHGIRENGADEAGCKESHSGLPLGIENEVALALNQCGIVGKASDQDLRNLYLRS